MAQVPDKESQKKQIGDLLRNADRYIKSAEWNKAFEEVNKALAIEPNNMYAMAYKDRINVSLAEEKKKAEEEKVKKLSDDKKGIDKPPEEKNEQPKETKETEKPPEEPKKEIPSPEQKPQAKEEAPAKGKDDSAARIESLRQEFASTQAKLQRDVAQLTMQLKEAQALKESAEKKLNAHIAELQKELSAAKQSSGSVNPKEIESLKEKHKKEVERAKEIAGADSLAQIAILQKELEQAKKASESVSVEKQGEEILRYVFDQAWKDGTVSNDKRAVLEAVKFALKISDAKFSEVEKATKGDAYINALRKVWIDGAISTEESDFLQSLREKLGIPAEEHFKMESRVRKELKK